VNATTLDLLKNLGADFGRPGMGDRPLASLDFDLPPDHIDFLAAINGLTAYHGAFRLFGFRNGGDLDIADWNAVETWRFAWGGRAEGYVYFGETALGDQYAYRLKPGSARSLGPEVYFLQATLLTPQVIAESFEEFLNLEFIRNMREPYDRLIVEAVETLGAISPAENWSYAPAIALGGPEDVSHLLRLPAAVAMTYSGDIVTGIYDNPTKNALAVVPWTDERGRSRLRLDFGA